MSLSVYLRVETIKTQESLTVSTPSRFLDAVRAAFGGDQTVFTQKELPTLKGLAAAWDKDQTDKNPFCRIVNLIQAGQGNTQVRIWAE